jgi:hypothetical protein
MNQWMMALAVALVVLGIWMILLIIHGSIHKSRWGVNFGWSGECPNCCNRRNMIRIPRNIRQFLWGGGTYTHCGLEVDKWNRPFIPEKCTEIFSLA